MKDEIRKLLRPQDQLRRGKWGSPVAITNDFLKHSPSEIFCKIDNDLVLCPGWLDAVLEAMEKQPKVDLVGVQPFVGSPAPLSTPRRLVSARHIGGVGVFRRRAFVGKPRPVPSGRFGFTKWQVDHPEVKKAWITPMLPAFLLDHLPFDPWRRLSERYRKLGWERRTSGCYKTNLRSLWSWWDGVDESSKET